MQQLILQLLIEKNGIISVSVPVLFNFCLLFRFQNFSFVYSNFSISIHSEYYCTCSWYLVLSICISADAWHYPLLQRSIWWGRKVFSWSQLYQSNTSKRPSPVQLSPPLPIEDKQNPRRGYKHNSIIRLLDIQGDPSAYNSPLVFNHPLNPIKI